MWSSPPRSTKSSILNVFWPAWTWLQEPDFSKLLGNWVQFLHVSHRDDLAVRDSQRCRQLVKSPWYQQLSGGRVQILPYADQSAYFGLEGGGARRAFSIRASLTGHDSDIQCIDDPLDVEAVLSAVEREHVYFVWDEMLPSRFNHPERNAQVLAAQRTHVADLHAHVLDSADYRAGCWRYDCIPGILEAGEGGEPRRLSEGEWRTHVGEVYWPERFTEESLRGLVKTAHAWAAQVQQNPQVRGAGVFRNAKWQFADERPSDLRLCRYWDKAATPEGGAQDPDYTAGALGAHDRDGRFWLCDMQHGRWSSHQVEQRLSLVAREIDPPGTPIWLEEEPGAAGKDVVSYYQRHILRGFAVRGDRPTGPKLVRVDPFLAAAEAGNVVLLRGAWNRAFLDECDAFTGDDVGHDDQVIAACGAHKCSARTGSLTQMRMHGL
jgi:predicted phage terminase large subunit-like protein